MKDNQYPQERTCYECGSVFKATNAKHKLCQASCRKAQYLKRKAQQQQEQVQQLREQMAQVSTLKKWALAPAQSVPTASAHWQSVDRGCQAQQALCHRISQAIEVNHQNYRLLRGPGKGFWRGLGISMILVGILIAICYDDQRRRRQQVGLTFNVVSWGSVVLMGWLGAQIGHLIQQGQMTLQEEAAFNAEVEELQYQKQALLEELKQEKDYLEVLLRARDQIDPASTASQILPSVGEEPLSKRPVTERI